MKKRMGFFLISIVMMGCARADTKDYSTINFSLIKLADGVYACIHKPGGKAIGNSGIVDNGEATIVFDTFLSPDVAEELIRIVEHLKLSPVKYVINSHFDNDHVRGNQCFSSDVKIISTERTAELIREEEPKAIAAEKIYAKKLYEYYDSLDRAFMGDTASGEYMTIKMMKPYFEELSQSHLKIRTRVPDTYVKGEMSLDGTRYKVLLIEKGKGHTESDLIMYLPEEGILFAGDLLFNKAHPWLGYGYTEELKERLTELELMHPLTIVPGHGDPGGAEMVTSLRKYIEDLERIAQELADTAKTLDDVESVPMPAEYRDWIIGDYFYSNLKYLFNKIND